MTILHHLVRYNRLSVDEIGRLRGRRQTIWSGERTS
jgi:hypothetical protein